jgi:hypothetical protein
MFNFYLICFKKSNDAKNVQELKKTSFQIVSQNDTQHNDIHHYDTQHNVIRY